MTAVTAVNAAPIKLEATVIKTLLASHKSDDRAKLRMSYESVNEGVCEQVG